MICGHIYQDYLKKRMPSVVFHEVIDFISQSNFQILDDGRYTIEGICEDLLYINIVTVKTEESRYKHGELHRDYVDFQYLIRGEEIIEYSNIESSLCHFLMYDREKDLQEVSSYSDQSTSILKLKSGMFVILYPNEIHKPNILLSHPMTIRKLVAKIHISLL
ncbi:YhcH/YjgK/YiaL family protein [Vibrio harveyi]|uniref:YhcH/YjgK/YiaL family protein n=1 Tax=Vibrio harveyi TaxID=669 RepID=UPI003CEBCE6E